MQNNKRHSSLTTAFAVASVYFGAVVGPDMVGGSTSIVYYTPYGKWSWIPIVIVCAISLPYLRSQYPLLHRRIAARFGARKER